MDITELLAFSHKQGASDLHLSSGLPPMIRVDGDIRRINVPALDAKEVYGLIYEIMNDKQRKEFEEFLECDFSFEIPGLARFRVNAYNQNRGAAGVFRTIPSKVLTMEDLGMGEIFRQIAQSTRGLITVTGPTGSGKTSGKVRLNHGGDRHANAALYQIVLTRMSSDAETRNYVRRRRAEGLSTREIMRCLKRYVARQTFKHLPRGRMTVPVGGV